MVYAKEKYLIKLFELKIMRNALLMRTFRSVRHYNLLFLTSSYLYLTNDHLNENSVWKSAIPFSPNFNKEIRNSKWHRKHTLLD